MKYIKLFEKWVNSDTFNYDELENDDINDYPDAIHICEEFYISKQYEKEKILEYIFEDITAATQGDGNTDAMMPQMDSDDINEFNNNWYKTPLREEWLLLFYVFEGCDGPEEWSNNRRIFRVDMVKAECGKKASDKFAQEYDKIHSEIYTELFNEAMNSIVEKVEYDPSLFVYVKRLIDTNTRYVRFNKYNRDGIHLTVQDLLKSLPAYLQRGNNAGLLDMKTEKLSDRVYGTDGLINSHTISKEMKEKILPYMTSNSYYRNKQVFDLMIPNVNGKNFDGVSLGADKNGFFVYTHRARSKSHETPTQIPDTDIKKTESTG